MCKSIEKSEMRYCNDIGMFTIDRSRKTCKHATSFCMQKCYNVKLYRIYKDMKCKDIRNDAYWQQLTGDNLAAELKGKHKDTSRVRFMSRGEAISELEDIDRIIDICKASPQRLFWLPTRAWRNAKLAWEVKQRLFNVKNLRLLASIDPSNTEYELNWLQAEGWSTMFFGNDETAPIANAKKCPKTWQHKSGHCLKCKGDAFHLNKCTSG